MKTLSKLALIAFLSLGSLITFAQKFESGTSVGSIGVGLGSSLAASGYSSSPGIALMYEKGLWKAGDAGIISLGGYLGYKAFKYEYNYVGYEWKYNLNYIILGARGTFHLTRLSDPKFDPYGGLMLSYNILNSSYTTNASSLFSSNYSTGSSGISLTGFLGARYYLSSNWAAYAELGYGVAYLTIGASYKF